MDRMLADYAVEHGYRINLKMRLRDVIDVEDLPLSAKERNFAFTSHLAFVAVDTKTHLPVIAIEYDGPQHLTDYKQIERDRIKDALRSRRVAASANRQPLHPQGGQVAGTDLHPVSA